MYDLGILGGMGPLATAEIFQRIVLSTAADSDQGHLRICVLNKPQIPDRSQYILNNGPSPLPYILEGIQELKSLGAKHFIIPCNTAHALASQFSQQEDIVFIDMIQETRELLKTRYPGQRACILGTEGTVKAAVYGREGAAGAPVVFYPNPQSQKEIMGIIQSVKAGKEPIQANKSKLVMVLEGITKSQGDCVFVLACTELSVVTPQAVSPLKLIDAMEVLAIKSIIKCGYRSRREL